MTVAVAKKRVGILISGRGSNMRSLVTAALAPDYPAEIAVVISNRPDAAGVRWAQAHDIPAIALDHKAYATRPDFEAALHQHLVAHGCELVACCGFMRLMTAGFVDQWHNRMLNIHPALLPAYKGLHTHARVLVDGVRITGCTVHVVRPEMDVGPIIAQSAVCVGNNDTIETLAARVLAAEHILYPHALALFSTGDAYVDGEIVQLRHTPMLPPAVMWPTL